MWANFSYIFFKPPFLQLNFALIVVLHNFIGTGSLESERGSFRSKSEGFGAQLNYGVRSKVDPVLSGSVRFCRLCKRGIWEKRMGSARFKRFHVKCG